MNHIDMRTGTRLVLLAIVGVVVSVALPSQQFTANDYFAVKPQDYRYLWYGSYENVFDSARIECTFGEIRLVSGGSVLRVPMRIAEHQWKSENTPTCVAGDTSRGRAMSLREYVRSEVFEVPPIGGAVKYLRMAAAYGSSTPHPSL